MSSFNGFNFGSSISTKNQLKEKLLKYHRIIGYTGIGIVAYLVILVCIILFTCGFGSGGYSERDKALHLIENYLSRGFYDQAEDKVNALLEENPDDEDLWSLLEKIKRLRESNDNGSLDKALLEELLAKFQNGSFDMAKLEELMAKSGNFDTSKLEELMAKNNAEAEKLRLQSEKQWAQEKEDAERRRKEDQLAYEKQREEDRIAAEKRAEKERIEAAKRLEQEKAENAKTMKEMQELLKRQQAQAEAEKKRMEDQMKQEKAAEEQRRIEAAAKKAAEEELARKNAQLKKEIDAVNEKILLGKGSLNSGDVNEALNYFREAQKLMPVSQGEPDFSASKYSEMAQALWDAAQGTASPEVKKQLEDNAKTYADTAVTKNPRDASSHYIIGMYSMDHKEYPKALDELTKAVTYDSKNYLYYYNLGRVQYMMKKFSAAKSSFGTSCMLNGAFAPARYNLGLTNNRLNDSKSALSDFRKAHDIEPRHEKAYLEEARVLSRQNDLNGAISAYLNVIKINNINRDALNELATVYSRAKKYADAETYYRKSLSILPNGTSDPLTYYNLSSVLYEEDKIDEALNYAKKSYDTKDSLKDNTAKANIVYNYALISEKTKDVDGAIKRYSEVLEYNPNHIKTHINLGTMYMSMTPPDVDTALQLFLKAYNIDRNNFEANNNLGSAYKNKKEYKESITYFLNALRLDSKNNEVRMNLAQAYASDQQYDNAKTTYLEVLKQDQSNWSAYLELAKVCMSLQDNTSAEKYLIAVQSKAPDFKKDEVSALLRSISSTSN